MEQQCRIRDSNPQPRACHPRSTFEPIQLTSANCLAAAYTKPTKAGRTGEDSRTSSADNKNPGESFRRRRKTAAQNNALPPVGASEGAINNSALPPFKPAHIPLPKARAAQADLASGRALSALRPRGRSQSFVARAQRPQTTSDRASRAAAIPQTRLAASRTTPQLPYCRPHRWHAKWRSEKADSKKQKTRFPRGIPGHDNRGNKRTTKRSLPRVHHPDAVRKKANATAWRPCAQTGPMAVAAAASSP